MKNLQWLVVVLFIGLIGIFWWREKRWAKKEAQWAGFVPDTVFVEATTEIIKTDTVKVLKPGKTVYETIRDTVFATTVDTLYQTTGTAGVREFTDRQPTFKVAGVVPFPTGRIQLAYEYFKKPIWKRFTFGLEGCIGAKVYISGDVNYYDNWGIGATYFLEKGNQWAVKLRKNF